jgi:hypothetical protein
MGGGVGAPGVETGGKGEAPELEGPAGSGAGPGGDGESPPGAAGCF